MRAVAGWLLHLAVRRGRQRVRRARASRRGDRRAVHEVVHEGRRLPRERRLHVRSAVARVLAAELRRDRAEDVQGQRRAHDDAFKGEEPSAPAPASISSSHRRRCCRDGDLLAVYITRGSQFEGNALGVSAGEHAQPAAQDRQAEPLRSVGRARSQRHGARGLVRLRRPRSGRRDRTRDDKGRRDVVGAGRRARPERLPRGRVPRQADDRDRPRREGARQGRRLRHVLGRGCRAARARRCAATC